MIPGTITVGKQKALYTVRVTKRGRVAIPACMRSEYSLDTKKFYLLHFNQETNVLYATFYETASDAPQPPLSFAQNRLEILPVFNKLHMRLSEGTIDLVWDIKNKAVKIDLKVLLL